MKQDPTPSVPPKTSTGAQNIKIGPEALGTAENETRSPKHEKGADTIGTAETIQGAQKKKTGLDALGTAENMSESAKRENGTRHPRYRWKRVQERKKWKWDWTPKVPPKMSPGAENLKKGGNAIGIVENEFRSAKHEIGTWHPQYHRKWVRERKTWNRDPTPSIPPKISPVAQNMKMGVDALRTNENEFGRAKIGKRDPTPSIPPKTSLGAQDMKTGPDALNTAENEYERAKKENMTKCHRYYRKWD
jgi:hypothetical protein